MTINKFHQPFLTSSAGILSQMICRNKIISFLKQQISLVACFTFIITFVIRLSVKALTALCAVVLVF